MPRSITEYPFTDPSYLDSLEEGFEREVIFDQARDMYNISRLIIDYLKVQPTYAHRYPELAKRAKTLVKKTSWIGFPLLSESEQVALLRGELLLGFSLPYFVLEKKLRETLAGQLQLAERDRLKKVFRLALLQNTEPYVSQEKSPDPDDPTTVGQWLRRYNAKFDDEPGSTLDRARFFTNPPGSHLAEEQQKQIRSLINTLEYLKLSSEGLESDLEQQSTIIDGQPYVWRAGQLEPVNTEPVADTIAWLEENGFLPPEESNASSDASTKEEDVPTAVTAASSSEDEPQSSSVPDESTESETAARDLDNSQPPPGTREVKTQPVQTEEKQAASIDERIVVNQVQQWRQQSLGAPLIAGRLLNAIAQRRLPVVYAALRYLAESGDLLTLVSRDRRFYNLLLDHYRRDGNPASHATFQAQASDPRYVGIFLQLALRRAGADDDTAAKAVAQLFDLLPDGRTPASPWVYFDEASGRYEWFEDSE